MMDEQQKLNPEDENVKQEKEETSDAKMQAELKELIELNEIKAGALKKIISKLNIDVNTKEKSSKS
jgi:hypothetical protein